MVIAKHHDIPRRGSRLPKFDISDTKANSSRNYSVSQADATQAQEALYYDAELALLFSGNHIIYHVHTSQFPPWTSMTSFKTSNHKIRSHAMAVATQAQQIFKPSHAPGSTNAALQNSSRKCSLISPLHKLTPSQLPLQRPHRPLHKRHKIANSPRRRTHRRHGPKNQLLPHNNPNRS